MGLFRRSADRPTRAERKALKRAAKAAKDGVKQERKAAAEAARAAKKAGTRKARRVQRKAERAAAAAEAKAAAVAEKLERPGRGERKAAAKAAKVAERAAKAARPSRRQRKAAAKAAKRVAAETKAAAKALRKDPDGKRAAKAELKAAKKTVKAEAKAVKQEAKAEVKAIKGDGKSAKKAAKKLKSSGSIADAGALVAAETSSREPMNAARARRLITVGQALLPVVAPYALTAANAARAQWDNRRAAKLGIATDQLATFSGPGGALHARISHAADALTKLEGLPETTNGTSAAGFISVSRPRLADLSVAVRAAEQMPTNRRKAAYRAIGNELDSIEATLLGHLGVTP